jgi:lipase maturation factor 1
VDLWQVGVILTANYTFLNYLVLAMGVLLLDDRFLLGAMPEKWTVRLTAGISGPETPLTPQLRTWKEKSGRYWRLLKLSSSAVMLTWIFYVTMAELLWMFAKLPLPPSPVAALEPFRIANRYGLFAVTTRGRYEIEIPGLRRRTDLGRISASL